MKRTGTIKLGFCPIGKFVFSHEDALRYKVMVEEKLKAWRIPYVSIDGVIKDGLVRDQSHVDAVVSHFKAEGVDGVFMPHCNFGTEGAVGMIGKKLAVPVLLWGPRDEAPLADGTRLRDTLCGLFASSKILHKLDVPFTYIENCRVEDSVFESGAKNFVRVLAAVKGFKNLRIGQIGGRIDFFWTTIVNESELLERFGIEIVPIDMVTFIAAVKKRAAANEKKYLAELKEFKKIMQVRDFKDERVLIGNFAMRDEMLERAAKDGFSAFAVESFMSICEELGCMVELALGMVSDAGVPAVTETDIHGAISAVLLQRASLDENKIFVADLTARHPSDDNGVLLFHCGGPLSMRDKSAPSSVGAHWIIPGIPPGSCHFKMKDGDLTIIRFDGDRGDYRIIAGEGSTMEGPYSQSVYGWMKVRDWKQWERKFIEGPYIHHVACSYGKHMAVIAEAVKYLPGGIILDLADAACEETGHVSGRKPYAINK